MDNTGGMSVDTTDAKRAGQVQLSVVVPVYGCADCLGTLHDRLTHSVSRVTENYELVFVDDRSEDEGWRVLQRLARWDPHPRALPLSRNLGPDAGITARPTPDRRE